MQTSLCRAGSARKMAPDRPEVRVRLVPMSSAQRADALREEAIEYADAKARAGLWTREESLDRARAEIGALVGPRPEDRGHEFFLALGGDGQRVGWLWLGPVPEPEASPDVRWMFQIVVDPPFRGRGFGRGLLAAAEAHVLATGGVELALNVFRWNAVAVHLYTHTGYRIVAQDDRAQEMRKRLAPG